MNKDIFDFKSILALVLIAALSIALISNATAPKLSTDTAVALLQGQGYALAAPGEEFTGDINSINVTAENLYAATGRAATYVIAASDSAANWTAQADVLCDGTNDGATIQTYLGTNNYNLLIIAPGSYDIDENNELSISPAAFSNSLTVYAYGANFNYTSGSGSILTINENLGVDNLWERRRINWYGGSFYGNSTALAAIRLNDVSGACFKDIYIQNFTASEDSNNSGILQYGTIGKMSESCLFQNIIMRNIYAGFTFRGTVASYSFGNNTYRDIHIEATGAASGNRGFRAPDAGAIYRCKFERCGVWLNKDWSFGFAFDGITDMAGTVFDTCAVELQENPVNCGGMYFPPAINLPTVISPLFSGTFHQGRILTSAEALGIHVIGSATYIAQNSGTASIADGNTITHGLAATPTTITLTGTAAGDLLTVTSVDATTITVAIKKHDGTADSTPQTVYWRAAIGAGN